MFSNFRLRSYSLTKKLAVILIPAFLILLIILWLGLPLFMAVMWSLVDPEYPWSYPNVLPPKLSLYPWVNVFKTSAVIRAISTSFQLAIFSAALSFLISLPTAFVMGRYSFRGRETLKVLMLMPLVLPGMTIALFLGRFLHMLGLSQSFIGVLLGHTLLGIPYMLRILTVNFESMPQDIIDAASNLGADRWTLFKEVYIPMILPGLFAGMLFSFIASMEEFNLSFIIGVPTIQTIPTVLFSYLGYNFIRPAASVVSLVLMIPNLILLIICERFIKTEYMGAALGKM